MEKEMWENSEPWSDHDAMSMSEGLTDEQAMAYDSACSDNLDRIMREEIQVDELQKLVFGKNLRDILKELN